MTDTGTMGTKPLTLSGVVSSSSPSHPEPVDVKAAVELVRKFAADWPAWKYTDGINDRVLTALSLIDRLQADNERMVEERRLDREALEKIVTLAKEGWNSSEMLTSLPPINVVAYRANEIARQRLQCSDATP